MFVQSIILIFTSFIVFQMGDSVALTKQNLTKISWDHAVNSQNKLNNALASDVDMLEADIILGVLKSDPKAQPFPVMGHPPENISDLSLESFLTQIYEYNQNNKTKQKGIKLDFKSVDVFELALDTVNSFYDRVWYPVWINADIISGPIDSQVTPVDADRFFNGAKQFDRSVLSVGWTTRYGPNITDGTYTEDQINEMLNLITAHKIMQVVTFPVRAGLAAKCYDLMQKLVDEVDLSTLTIWSSQGDPVDIEALRKLIFSIGLDRTYVDVPEDLRKQLHLDHPPKDKNVTIKH